ncbi:group 3 secretory phospholipase A2 isoform X3 [Manacus candei]|uniref:group 3 secretory phospholipase A2 isoform X3 n=1 Tax=Manacus candei TaxID=415023 RepID=UPI002226A2E2|nr:group 3 secretory phospholipase A2 isoform X3 [Manacus candei]
MWVRVVVAGAVLCACARAWPGGAVCAREAAGGSGARYVAFLGRGTGPGPALVEGALAAPGRLRACWARRDPRLVRAFRAACARRPPAVPGAALRRALSALWRRRAVCTDPAKAGAQRQRRRRGWTLPGTLWCGAGDSAGNWSELGLFRGPDRCCREHDQCWAQITALQFNYGIRNYRLHTVSHCDCDARFRHCLLAINDTVSNIIGVTFFNLLEVPCFVLEESEECIQWHWWGGCKRYGVVPLARMVQQSQYHPSLPAEERGSSAAQPPGKGRNSSRAGRKRLRQELEPKPGRRQAQRPETAQQDPGLTMLGQDPAGARSALGRAEQGAEGLAHPWDGSVRPSPTAAAWSGPTPVPTVEERRQQGELVPWVEHAPQLGCLKASAWWGHMLGVPFTSLLSSGPGRVCRCYKHLGKCEHQIAPHEVRYQLHNVNSQTLLHCNCTRRLERCLRRVRNCSNMEVAVLANHIATDCFVLEQLVACSPGRGSQDSSCTTVTRAVLLPAKRLKKTLRRWGPLHVSSKTKHPDWKTQARGGILCEQCQHLAMEQGLGAQPHTVPR